MGESKCAVCGGVFEKEWSDEEAREELEENLGDINVDECAVFCDDCYKKIINLIKEFTIPTVDINILTERFKEYYKKLEHEFIYGTGIIKPVGVLVDQAQKEEARAERIPDFMNKYVIIPDECSADSYKPSKTIVYIAGKITGDENYRRKFKKAEKRLKRTGYVVINPAVLPKPSDGIEYEKLMKICFSMIDQADAIFLLNDWSESPGAKREFVYAQKNDKYIFHE